MEKASFLFLVVLLASTHLLISGAAASRTTTFGSAASNFIKTKCTATRYPVLCMESLAVYANAIQESPRQLAMTAMNVSLIKAQSTMEFVHKVTKIKTLKRREIAAVKDCLDEVGDSIDQLGRSVDEMKQTGESPKIREFRWHMSNMQTWVSAALTNENTCFDEFAGRALDGRIKNSIRGRIVHVAQVTSNALSLVNQFAGQY